MRSSFLCTGFFSFGLATKFLARSPQKQEYDYIVIGGGASGCVVGRSLSDAGKRVLVIDRGLTRDHAKLTNSISGVGVSLGNRNLAQLVVTASGIRSHQPLVLGGGTSVNYGIWIEEQKSYFDHFASHVTKLNEKIFSGRIANSKLYQDMTGMLDYDTKVVPAYEWVRKTLRLQRSAVSTITESILKKSLVNSPFRHEDPNETTITSATIPSPIGKGVVWHPYSLFDSEMTVDEATVLANGSEVPRTVRTKIGHRHAADELLRDAVNVDILTENKVWKIEFDSDRVARCVLVKHVTREDTRSIGKVMATMPFDAVLASMSNTYIQSPVSDEEGNAQAYDAAGNIPLTRLCVKEGGEIIVASGAIETPQLLWRSGIGSPEQIARASMVASSVVSASATPPLGSSTISPIIVNNPMVGENLMDRVLVPIVFYSNSKAPKDRLSAEICSTVGIGKVCLSNDAYAEKEDFDAGEECDWVSFEEAAGGRILEGMLTSTRTLLPPGVRSSVIGDLLETAISSCEDIRWGSPQRTKIPDIPTGIGGLTTGEVCDVYYKPFGRCIERMIGWWYFLSHVKSRGKIYMDSDNQIVVDPNYFGEPGDLKAAIRGVSTLVKTASNSESGLKDFLLPRPSQSSDEDVQTKDPICPFGQFSASSASFYTQLTKAYQCPASYSPFGSPEERGSSVDTNTRNGLCGNLWHGKLTVDGWGLPVSQLSTLLSGGAIPEGIDTPIVSSLPFATFPPVIPESDDLIGIEGYVRNTATSMWHWAGSASMGLVVDEAFNVYGTRNLRIVDASVLPLLPRANPTATIMAIARISALKILSS